jgi:hypothetical protein
MGMNGKINLLKESRPIFIDGFEVVEIDGCFWTIQNLNLTRFRNGDEIFESKTEDEWQYCSLTQMPAWCYFENNPQNSKLYNAFCVLDKREISPIGWEIANGAWEIKNKVSPQMNGYRNYNGSFSDLSRKYFFWRYFYNINEDYKYLRELIKNNCSSYGGLDAIKDHYRISVGTIEPPLNKGKIDLRMGVGHNKRDFNLGDGYFIRLKKQN